MVGDQGARTASLTQRTFHFDTCCLFSVRATRPTEKAYASARVNRKQNEVTVLCCVFLYHNMRYVMLFVISPLEQQTFRCQLVFEKICC